MLRLRNRAVAGLAVLGLALAACGGDDDDGTTAATDAPAETQAPAATDATTAPTEAEADTTAATEVDADTTAAPEAETTTPATEAGGADLAGAEVVIGSVDFPENNIMAQLYAIALEEAGANVTVEAPLGSREVLQPAIQDGQIDLAPEYVATLLAFLVPDVDTTGRSVEEVVPDLNTALADVGQTALDPAPAFDENGEAVTRATADELGIATLSDLAEPSGELTFGGPPECPERAFCIPGLMEVYGIEFAEFLPLDVGGPLTVEALKNGDIDVGLLFTTDPAIVVNDFVLLEDDMDLNGPDNLIPVIRTETLDAAPGIADVLNAISPAITVESITQLIVAVAVDGESPEDVARQFLTDEGLI